MVDIDAKGLIRDAYLIEGIGPEECRSIFLDWALSLPDSVAPAEAIKNLLATYEPGNQDHPMTKVLKDGLDKPARTGRRGGRKARLG